MPKSSSDRMKPRFLRCASLRLAMVGLLTRMPSVSSSSILVRAQAVALDHAEDVVGEVRVAELHRRDVDRHLEARPAQQVLAGPVDDEAADLVDETGLLGDRNEERRRDGAELLRGPAHQRLDADDGQIAGAHDRLVEDPEVALLDRPAERGLDLLLLERARLHRRVIGDRLALGAVLGVIHRDVGAADDLARRQAGADGDGVADRDGDVELEAVDGEGLVETVDDRRRRPGGGVAHRLADQSDRELVAADAGEDGVGRKYRVQAGGQRLDQFVAAVVADRVVDRLEAVDVEIDDRELARLARRPGTRASRAAR